MKKLLLLLVSLTLLGGMAHAQQEEYPANQLAVSYGILNNSEIVNALGDVFSVMFGAKIGDSRTSGPIGVEYFRGVSQVVSVGGIALFNHKGQDIVNSDKQKMGNRSVNWYTLMPAVKFDWLRRNHFGLYSKLAAGVSMMSVKNDYSSSDGSQKDDTAKTSWAFNWQASAIGIEAGGTTVRGFLEAGIGEQGIIAFGVRTRF